MQLIQQKEDAIWVDDNAKTIEMVNVSLQKKFQNVKIEIPKYGSRYGILLHGFRDTFTQFELGV